MVRAIEVDTSRNCAIEIVIGTEAKTARSAKFGEPCGTKDPHEMSVRAVVFTDRRHGIGRSKWILA
jgi:hypothetical protein